MHVHSNHSWLTFANRCHELRVVANKIGVLDWGIWCYTSCGLKRGFMALLVKGLMYKLSFGWYLSSLVHNHWPRSFNLGYCGPYSISRKNIDAVTQLTQIDHLPLSLKCLIYDSSFHHDHHKFRSLSLFMFILLNQILNQSHLSFSKIMNHLAF